MSDLPRNEPAEAALVARLLMDPGQLPLVKLAPEDFYSPTWRLVFRGMQDLQAQHRSIDIVALQQYAPAENLSDMLLAAGPTHRAPVDEYAQMIRDTAFRRRMIGSLDGVTREAYQTDDNQGLVSKLQDAVSNIVGGADAGGLVSPERAVEGYERLLRQRAEGEGGGLRWDIPSLDRLIQPAGNGDMVVLAARPSVGKTTLAEILADSWAAQAGKPVLFASLEMSINSLQDRAVARYGNVDAARVLRGNLTPPEQARVAAVLEERRRGQVWYLNDPYATTGAVRAACAQVKILAGAVGAIVIDYMQLLKDPGDQEVQRVTRISRQVKAIAREFDAPVLALSQLNRASTFRDDPHPRLSDLRESGAIEQDADLVIGLHRQLDERVVDLEVLKNRATGRVGRISIEFDDLIDTGYEGEE